MYKGYWKCGSAWTPFFEAQSFMDELASPSTMIPDGSIIKVEAIDEYIEEFGVMKNGRISLCPNVEKFITIDHRYPTFTKNWEVIWRGEDNEDKLANLAAKTLPNRKLIQMLYACFEEIDNISMKTIEAWLRNVCSNKRIHEIYNYRYANDMSFPADIRCAYHILAIVNGSKKCPLHAVQAMALGRLHLVSQSNQISGKDLQVKLHLLSTIRRVISVYDLIESVCVPV